MQNIFWLSYHWLFFLLCNLSLITLTIVVLYATWFFNHIILILILCLFYRRTAHRKLNLILLSILQFIRNFIFKLYILFLSIWFPISWLFKWINIRLFFIILNLCIYFVFGISILIVELIWILLWRFLWFLITFIVTSGSAYFFACDIFFGGWFSLVI